MIVSSKAHCNLCILNGEDVKKVRDRYIVFLDIDGVLMPCRHVEIAEELAKLFGDLEKGKRWTEYQKRAAMSCHLPDHSINQLMSLIRKIEESGKEAGIVISSSWGHDGTTEQVCKELFDSHPFSKYIIGRTPTTESDDPEVKRLRRDKSVDRSRRSYRRLAKKYGLDLDNRADQIRYWILEHKLKKHFVILDDAYLKRAFECQSVWIDTNDLLTERDVELAWKILNE